MKYKIFCVHSDQQYPVTQVRGSLFWDESSSPQEASIAAPIKSQRPEFASNVEWR